MTLNDLIPIIEFWCLVEIKFKNKIVYNGINESLKEKIDNKFLDLSIMCISPTSVIYTDLPLPALQILLR